jgi:hypothetical protein
MSRIRSIHPGLATDENFVTVSIPARYFFVLLLTECDDQGVFEWKPLSLKMRLFPGDNIDVAAMLTELASIDAVRQYAINGRQLGAVRNFRKFQKPRFPNAVHPISEDIRNYVALTEPITVTPGDESDQPPRNAEKSLQMDDGEDVGDEKKEKAYAFAGHVVRLKRADHQAWRKAYSSIPDLDAELRRIDDTLAAEGKTKGWFPAASAMLAAKHQKLLSAQKPATKPAITPFGVGG